MKKYILTIVVVLFVYMGCDINIPGMGVDIPDDPIVWIFTSLHIRNMSITSGVTYMRSSRDPDSGSHTYLDPSPQPGIPVDTVIQICVGSNYMNFYTHDWWVERAIDSVVIDSGEVLMSGEKWLLIEEDSTGWSCTWSNSGW